MLSTMVIKALPSSFQGKIESSAEFFQIGAKYFGDKVDLWSHFGICAAFQMQCRC